MSLTHRAAVLHRVGDPLVVETVHSADPGPTDVVVQIKAAGICHTDLEAMSGSLRHPLPMILGHEAAGIIEEVGSEAGHLRAGDHVILSWNPHCGHCFQCRRDQPILCDTYLAEGPAGHHFDGRSKARLASGEALHHLMFLGAFAKYCVVPAQQAIVVSAEIPFASACLIGCGVMTGVGGAVNIAHILPGDTVMVVGCGAVGLAAVQGARMAGAGAVIAVDLEPRKLVVAALLGASLTVDATAEDPVAIARATTKGRGVDVVIECAGHPSAFRLSVEAVRPGGEVVWLGKIDVDREVSFRWGALMGEKQLRRSSYGGARPERDFPLLVEAYLAGRLRLDELITKRIGLDDINAGFELLRRAEAIRTVVEL